MGAGRAGGCVGCRQGRRALGARACWASGRRRAGRLAAGGAGGRLGERQQASGHGMDARGGAAGASRGARGGRLGGLCASGVRSWARLGVLVHLTQFLALFDSVFFPSHQMNTVHCKINFFLKKKYFKFN